MKKNNLIYIVAIFIGSALGIILDRLQIMGIFPEIFWNPACIISAVCAVMFGPIAGGSIGLVVNLISYILFASGNAVNILSYTMFGLIMGLFCGKNDTLSKKDILKFNIVQGVTNVFLFIILVPVLEAFYTGGIEAGGFMMQFTSWNEFLKAALANTISIGVWGTLVLFFTGKLKRKVKA